MTERFLSLKEVGERLGVKNPAAKGYNLPEPDALIGATRGWLPETIDRWNAARPGRGVGGGVYGQINVYGVTTKSERHKRSYWTRTADGNGIGGRKAPVPYGS